MGTGDGVWVEDNPHAQVTVAGAATGKYVASLLVTNALQFPKMIAVPLGTLVGAFGFWLVNLVAADGVGVGDCVAVENDIRELDVTS